MLKHMKSMSAIALVAATWGLTGCAKTPTGQVVAVVNGEEVTLQELNAELSEMNVPANADKKAARQAVLQQIVNRRLLAQSAKQAGLDRDPDFIIQKMRAEEMLLVNMYGKKAMDSVKVPDSAAIDKYIAENPKMFGQRTLYKLDQIQFEMPADPKKLEALKDAHTLAAVADGLTKLGLKFTRGNGTFDSGKLPPDVLNKILALAPGEPFIVPSPDRTKGLVNVITGSQPLAIPPEQLRPMAVQALRNSSLAKIGDERLKEAKASAKIEYQPGYEPPAQKK